MQVLEITHLLFDRLRRLHPDLNTKMKTSLFFRLSAMIYSQLFATLYLALSLNTLKRSYVV